MAKYKIIPSSRTIVQSPISIGHKAEKGVEAIEFDLTAWVETYGSGTATIIMRRWGDEIPYPVALELDEDNKATWTLSDIDTAKAGMAYAQLNYIVGDAVVKKSDIYTFRVMDSLTGEGEPPEAYDSWLEHLTHLAAEAMAEVLDIEGIVTDKTLTVDGGIADGKATGDALALKADKSTTYTKTEVDRMIDGVEVETDTTLTIEGAAADAAETGRQIGLLKADLADVESGYLTYELVPNSYVKTNGDVEVYSGWSRTNYIPCTPNEKIMITFPVESVYCQWYASDKTSVGQLRLFAGTNVYVAPANAYYYMISHANANMANLQIRQLAKESDLLNISDNINELKYFHVDKTHANSVPVGYINSSTGDITPSASYDTYIFKNIGYENVECTTTLLTGCGAIAFYSGDDPIAENVLSITPIKASGAIRSYSETVPTGTKLIAISNLRSYSSAVVNLLLPFGAVYESAVFGSGISKADISTLNQDIEHVVFSSSAFNGTDYNKIQHKYFTVLLGSDIHRDVANYNRMIDYAKRCNILDAVLVPGDFNASHFNEAGFEETYVARYQDLDIPTLLVMGNHDVGDGITKEIYKSVTPNTVDGCTSRFITPYMAYNDCVQGSGGYYYRDFDNYNIRVIALNEYELPRIDNPNNSSKYLYNYWNRYISQTQVDWLVSALNSVPTGYGVIVLMHQMVDQITEYTDNKFNNPNYVITNGDHMTAQGPIIQDIIDAYMTRSTLSETYANTLSAPSTDIPDVTVSADFSNSNGEFICYICGHTHADKIGQSSLATQKQVVEVANTASTTKAYYDDLWRQVGTKSQDCLNLLVFDTDKKKIRILRIGANSTLNMEWRDMTSIFYT